MQVKAIKKLTLVFASVKFIRLYGYLQNLAAPFDSRHQAMHCFFWQNHGMFLTLYCKVWYLTQSMNFYSITFCLPCLRDFTTHYLAGCTLKGHSNQDQSSLAILQQGPAPTAAFRLVGSCGSPNRRTVSWQEQSSFIFFNAKG